MTGLSSKDIQETVGRYSARYAQFGYSPKTLGWNNGRQLIRFQALTSMFSLAGKRILDIGCGFGDLNSLLRANVESDYQYHGIDLVPDLINEAKRRFPEPNIAFTVGDFSQTSPNGDFDIAIASGIFNHKLSESDNYGMIEETVKCALGRVKVGIAFDFLSDRVDLRREHTFHSDPMRILELGYKYSRRVTLRNDYLPFEFALIVFRNDEVDSTNSCYMTGPKPEASEV